MKAFIDLGAYKGDTIEQFYNWGHLLSDPKEFQIFAFEPNSDCWNSLNLLAKQKGNLSVIGKAAWVKDGDIDFIPDGIGATTMKTKKNWDQGLAIKVPCLDFSEWMTRFTKDDFIVLKIDIEGAEFEVLEKMIKDGTISLVDHLWVEFHQNKVTDYTTQYKNELVDRIKKIVPNFWEWH